MGKRLGYSLVMENINAATKTIKKGQRYNSKVWLNPTDNSPLVCLVTKVASGTVYYRGDYGKHDDGTPWLGSAACFPIEQTEKWFDISDPALMPTYPPAEMGPEGEAVSYAEESFREEWQFPTR